MEAAAEAGITKVILPEYNWQESFERSPMQIIPVKHIEQVFAEALKPPPDRRSGLGPSASSAQEPVELGERCPHSGTEVPVTAKDPGSRAGSPRLFPGTTV